MIHSVNVGTVPAVPASVRTSSYLCLCSQSRPQACVNRETVLTWWSQMDHIAVSHVDGPVPTADVKNFNEISRCGLCSFLQQKKETDRAGPLYGTFYNLTCKTPQPRPTESLCSSPVGTREETPLHTQVGSFSFPFIICLLACKGAQGQEGDGKGVFEAPVVLQHRSVGW